MVLNKLRHSLGRFLDVLDGEGVALFQALVYMDLSVGGLYCLLIAGVPSNAVAALGPHADTAWLWLCAAAGICMVGKVLSNRSDRRKYWVFTTGLWLQLCGDLSAIGAFYGFVLATFEIAHRGPASIAAWVFFALGDCATLLTIRDVRRILQAETKVRA
jgi:hypothetical protein